MRGTRDFLGSVPSLLPCVSNFLCIMLGLITFQNTHGHTHILYSQKLFEILLFDIYIALYGDHLTFGCQNSIINI